MENLPDENSKRFVAILNKKVDAGRTLNALGHMVVGLAGGCLNTEDICFLQYQDADGGVHPNLSHYPFIVLKADSSNKIRTVRNEALARNIPFTDFTDDMIIGTSNDQMASMKQKREEELEYYGICLFGETDVLREFTSKFSLYT